MSLEEQLESYESYHRDPRNIKTHFIGVPLVVLGLFIAMSWVRWPLTSGVEVTLAQIFWLLTFIYYLKVDLRLALTQLPISLLLLLLGDHLSQLPKVDSIGAFLMIFTSGWFFQLLGHYFEGKRPALVDNFWQVFNAPLFLAAEVLWAFGLYPQLRSKNKPSP